jgi:hypothetical protein
LESDAAILLALIDEVVGIAACSVLRLLFSNVRVELIMSIENSEIIDFVGIDKYGNAMLTISDHLEWDIKNEHLLLLQNKITAYLGSIESGDLYNKYPDAKNRKIVINLVMKYWPSHDGIQFLERMETFLNEHGYQFAYEIFSGK